jgi:hypothetical protein
MENTSKKIDNKNSSVTVFSDRWGLITSLILEWVELLYQDMYDETLLDESKSVRWGIPYMFPNAWPLTEKEEEKSWFKLIQHWKWRISKWEEIKVSESWRYLQKYSLKYSDDFPYELAVENNIELRDNNFITTHVIKNNWEKKAPISTWFHPYFRVPKWKKEYIEWNFTWWEKIKDDLSIWGNDWTITVENIWTPLEVYIPWIWTLIIEVSQDYKKFWIWSLPWKDFICIEPVMGDEWAIVNSPVLIKVWEENTNYMKITLKK